MPVTEKSVPEVVHKLLEKCSRKSTLVTRCKSIPSKNANKQSHILLFQPIMMNHTQIIHYIHLINFEYCTIQLNFTFTLSNDMFLGRWYHPGLLYSAKFHTFSLFLSFKMHSIIAKLILFVEIMKFWLFNQKGDYTIIHKLTKTGHERSHD